ncbi:MAG: hypothetical protein JW915_06065 [Chitinispirillaceae bacterium]|nr:hypothetical protein [Chitinispirillaceae bacterium]
MSVFLKTVLGLLFIIIITARSSVLNVPESYSTIQSAIDSADDGDTVLVAAGEYYEGIDFYGKKIVVGSKFILDQDTTWISRTVIRDSLPEFDTIEGELVQILELRNQVVFDSSENDQSVMSGFTILDEEIIISGASKPSFRSNCIEATMITDTIPNNASRMMVITDSSWTVSDLKFKNSYLQVYGSHSPAIITDNFFYRSNVLFDGSASQRTVKNNKFEYSSFSCMVANDSAEITKNSFLSSCINCTGTRFDSQYISISDNMFTSKINWRSELIFGGTGNVFIHGDITRNCFDRTTVSFRGTGRANHQICIDGNLFTNDNSKAGYLSFDGTGCCFIKANIKNNRFISVPVYFAGTGDYYSQVVLSHNIFTQSRNGGIIIQPISSALQECTITNNTIVGNGRGIDNRSTSRNPPQISIVNSIIWNNGTDLVNIDQKEISHSLYQTGLETTGNGNIRADPQFVNIKELDFNLNPQSPCINSGDSTSLPDLDSSRADIGAVPFETKIDNVEPAMSDSLDNATMQDAEIEDQEVEEILNVE